VNYTIWYNELALQEYEDATEWYREKSEKAAINFETEVLASVELLRFNPYNYKRGYKQFREVSLKRYPYSIIYFIAEEERLIIILSFFHHKRNPKKKYTRK
jgi:plasmid stabilization system protein ParE